MNKQTKDKLKISELVFKNFTMFLLFLVVGVCLDNYLNTKPLFMVVFVVITLIVCTFAFIKTKI